MNGPAKAMKLPTAVMWPDSQVLFLLIGGKDNFRPMANESIRS